MWTCLRHELVRAHVAARTGWSLRPPSAHFGVLRAGGRRRRATRRCRRSLRSEESSRSAVCHDGSAEDRAVGGGADGEVDTDAALHRLVQRVGNRLDARPAGRLEKPPALDGYPVAGSVRESGVAVSVNCFAGVEPDPPRSRQREAGGIARAGIVEDVEESAVRDWIDDRVAWDRPCPCRLPEGPSRRCSACGGTPSA